MAVAPTIPPPNLSQVMLDVRWVGRDDLNVLLREVS
jgi:hypothetical protein